MRKALFFLIISITLSLPSAHAEITFGPDVRVDDTGTAASKQSAPQIVTDKYGNIYLVWSDYRSGPADADIYFAKSTDRGITFSRPNKRVSDDAGIGRHQWSSSIAVEKNSGNIYVTWHDARNINLGWDVYFAKSTDGGATFSNNLRINKDTTNQGQGYPKIATDALGNIYIVWDDARDYDTNRTDIYFAKSIDGGIFFGENIRVDDTKSSLSSQALPAIAIDINRNIYIVWQDWRNGIDGNSDIYFAKSIDGGATFSTNVPVSDDIANTSKQRYPSIAVDSTGKNIYVVWEDNRNDNDNYDIYFAKSTDGGVTFTANVRVDDGPPDIQQQFPEIAVTPNGDIYFSWTDDHSGSEDIYFTQSIDGGISFSPSIRIDNGPDGTQQRASSLAVAPNGDIDVAWMDERDSNYDIYFAKGQETTTNHPPVLDPIGHRTGQENSLLQFFVVAADSDNENLTFSHPLASELPPGASFIPVRSEPGRLEGQLTWTPTYEQAGTYPLRFEVKDPSNGIDAEELTITVNNVNRAPILEAIGNKTAYENSNLSFTILAADPDLGDSLTYSVSNNLPLGASFNPQTRTFTWTPTIGQAGTYSNISFTVTDNASPPLSDSEDITITVQPEDVTPPVTSDDYDNSWHNQDFIISLSATDSQTGVKVTYYNINGGPTQSVSVSGQPRITQEGAHNPLEYWSIDYADNEELPHWLLTNIKLDTTSPELSITSPDNGQVFPKNPITITGSVTDHTSGVKAVEVNVGATPYYPELKPDGSFTLANVTLEGGPNKIEVSADDLAGNTVQKTLTVYKGWVLRLDLPFYPLTSYGSGAASCQMVLNYLRNTLAPQLTQDQIYNYGHPYNYPENTSLLEMDPQAIDYALGHFDPYDAQDPTGQGNDEKGYNFDLAAFASDKFSEYLRDIIHWLAYPVAKDYWWQDELAKWPNTPAVLPAYGSYGHWVVVHGASTDQNPVPNPRTDPWYTPDFTVYGLWLTDPTTPGIGQNVYVTAQEAEQTYLLPLASADQHNSQFLQVAEPPHYPSNARVQVSPPIINQETLKLSELAKALPPELPANLLKVNLTGQAEPGKQTSSGQKTAGLLNLVFVRAPVSSIKLDWQKLLDPSLLTDPGFKQAFDGAHARGFLKVRRPDKNSYYYLVPFDKYLNGEVLTSAAIIMATQNGSFQQASWVKEPARFIQLSKEKAVQLALAKHLELRAQRKFFTRFTNKHLQAGLASAELIWESKGVSSSPFYPYWQLILEGGVYLVTQEGRVTCIREPLPPVSPDRPRPPTTPPPTTPPPKTPTPPPFTAPPRTPPPPKT